MSFSNEPAFDEPKTNSIENALGASLRYQVPKIFPLSSTMYILERVAGKICLDFLHSFLKQRYYAAKILVLYQHHP